MVGYVVAAHIAFDVLNPTLSSRSLAFEMNKSLRPDDQIALYGDIRVAPGIAFYSHRPVLLYNATESNLEFGSHYPDAPKRFFNDLDFLTLWEGKGRVFLVVRRCTRRTSVSGFLPIPFGSLPKLGARLSISISHLTLGAPLSLPSKEK